MDHQRNINDDISSHFLGDESISSTSISNLDDTNDREMFAQGNRYGDSNRAYDQQNNLNENMNSLVPRTTWGYGDDDGDNTDMREEEYGQIAGVDDLPLFSNQLTKQLNKQIHEKENIIVEYDGKISDLRERVKIMKEHFKNVQSELLLTNNVANSKKMEIQTEKHLKMLTLRSLEKEKLNQKTLKANLEQIQDNLNNIQNTIFQSNQKLDEFKLQMNWNQSELEQWVLAAKQKEDDNNIIAKYAKIDEQKIKDLNFELEKLSKELLAHKENLDNEIIETQAKQMELDRIAADFKASHNERKDLIVRWQEIINEIKKRDIDINLIGERFAIAKIERANREKMINIQRDRLTAQLNENKEVESKFESLSRIVVKKREEMIAGSLKLQEFRDELESIKNELTTSAEALVLKRKLNVNKSQLVEDRKATLEKERRKFLLVKEKLEFVKVSTNQVEITARNAQDVLDQKEKELNVTMNHVKENKEKLFKESQVLYELKREEQRLKNEVSGSKLTIKNLDAGLIQLDRDASRQQEHLYNAEFQIQQIERKISRGMGERSDDEKKELKLQIEENEKLLSDIKDKKKTLQAQSRKLSNELALMKLHKDEQGEKRSKLKDKLGEKEVENKLISEEIKRDTKEKEDRTVQNDLHRLDVKRLKDLLSAKADAVYSLENRKQQLKLSMEERKTEIAVHRDVLKAELKTMMEEKHNLVMDLRNREAQVEKLKSRYDSIANYNTGTNEEDDGPTGNKDNVNESSKFQSYYIIKAAQRREELTRKGDELDFAIRQCERELRAQQLTLDHLNARNVAFRDSFKKVDTNSDESEVLAQLEDQVKLTKDNLFRKKKEFQRLNTDIEDDERRLEQVKGQYSRLCRQKENLDNAKSQVQEEIMTQDGQLEDLNNRIKVLATKHRASTSATRPEGSIENTSLEEKSAYAEVMKDCVQNVLYTLGQLSAEFPELADYMTQRLRDADLRIPTKPPTRAKTTANVSAPIPPGFVRSSADSSTQSARTKQSRNSKLYTPSSAGLSNANQNSNRSRNNSSIVVPTTTFELEI